MKIKKLWIIILILASTFIISACQILPWVRVARGSGNLVTETRQVSGFDAVQLDGALRLVIIQGAQESLEIEAEDNLIGDLTSEVKGNTLILSYRDQRWRRIILPSRPVVYTLTVTDLTELILNGAADLEIGALETNDFNLQINGAGNTVINNLSAQSLSVTLTGTGSITINGTVTTQNISLDGAGNYQAGDLETQSSAIEINGLGNATVWATQSLNVSINGGGSVSYYGTPSITQEISGLGNIRSLGEK